MQAIGTKWLDKANAYQGKASAKYDWVWEYAKFRLELVFENVRYIEEKSISLLKTVLAVSAILSAAASFALPKLEIDAPLRILLGLGIMALIAAACFCLAAFNPTERELPFAEDVALRFVDAHQTDGQAQAGFSLATAEATQRATALISVKGGHVLWGARLTFVAISLFSLCGVWVCLKTIPIVCRLLSLAAYR